MNVLSAILQAEQRIRPAIRTTPLEYSRSLSDLTGCNVFLKLENLQHTGSFKLRGAMNALLSLTQEQRAGGIVTASSGNHGHAVAFGLHAQHLPGVIFVPEGTSTAKIAAIQQYGVDLRVWGDDAVKTEEYARAYADQQNMVYISPYNDLAVIGGQGTIGVELCRQSEKIDVVLAALGGGGMIAGIGEYVKAVYPDARIIGCSPEHSPVMARSVQAGHIVEMTSLPTLSDGTAGGIEADAITFPLCQRLVNDYVLVSEDEIGRALRLCLEKHHLLIEGAAAVPLAALLKQSERFQGQNVIVVLCGANISLDTLRGLL